MSLPTLSTLSTLSTLPNLPNLLKLPRLPKLPKLPFTTGLRAALAATLLAGATLSVQAADYNFNGVIDSGPLTPAAFSGSFSFADPVAGFDGSVDLSSFSLLFQGQSYTLASADAGWQPVAWFAGGSLTGVDYQDSSAVDPSSRPHVYMTAGFSDLSDAFFGYDTSGAGVQGFGSLTVSVVPEPGSAALLLAGLLSAGLWARRRD